MSTRTQIRMKDDHGVVQIYVHSDGYPSSIVRNLKKLNELNQKMGTQRDASYTLAQYIFMEKLRAMKFNVASDLKHIPDYRKDGMLVPDDPKEILDLENFEKADQPLFMLGQGVENPHDGIHGDEEYLYFVDITPQLKGYRPDEWRIKVSEHIGFPRWQESEDLEGDPFDHTDWQFEGKLKDAFEEFL